MRIAVGTVAPVHYVGFKTAAHGRTGAIQARRAAARYATPQGASFALIRFCGMRLCSLEHAHLWSLGTQPIRLIGGGDP